MPASRDWETGLSKNMKSRKMLTRILPRDAHLCGAHVGGCGLPIRNRRYATVDHIFTKSFFNDREDGVEPKHYNKDWNWSAYAPEMQRGSWRSDIWISLIHLFLPLASDRPHPQRLCLESSSWAKKRGECIHSLGWTPQLGQRRGQVKRDSRWKV